MTRVLVWNCADEDLKEQADKEITHLSALCSDDFDVTVAGPSIGWQDIAHIARGARPTIFHFIGHGDKDANLGAREHGNEFIFRQAVEVIAVIRAASRELEGAFLSACYSSKIGPELLRPLPPVGGWAIGTTTAIRGDEAADFSRIFYQHLAKEPDQTQQAFDIAAQYARADYPNPPHRAWFSKSPLPNLDEMERDIYIGLWNVLDRDAFRLSLRREVSMAELNVALEDVSMALKTGQVLSRQDRRVIQNISFPAEWLGSDPHIREFVRTTRRNLSDARRALSIVMAGTTDDRFFGDVSNLNPETPAHVWMSRINSVDLARNRILTAANSLADHANLSRFSPIALSFTPAEIESARR